MKRAINLLLFSLIAINSFAMNIEIKINGKTFTAEIEDSETGRAFYSLLPMTLDMSELNGNEKYHYLMSGLPTDAHYCSSISAGDLMLYGNSCIVLFYGNAGGYSYTRLGKFTSTAGLAEAVGSGSVSVTFSPSSTAVEQVATDGTQADAIHDLDGRILDTEPTKGVFIKNGKKIIISES